MKQEGGCRVGATEEAGVKKPDRKTRWLLAKEESPAMKKGSPGAVPALHAHLHFTHFPPHIPTDPSGS